MHRKLAAHRGFTGTLQTCHEDDSRRLRSKLNIGELFTKQGDHFIVDDFDDLLAGGQALKDFRADTLLGNSLDELFDDLAEKNADESFSPGHKRGREADVDPDHMVRSDLDEELVRKNTKKFWLLFAVTSPITLVVLGATAAAFALLFFLIAVLIIAFVAGLVAVTAAGTLISVLGLIFGVVQAITTLPIGLYECGLSIMIGASAMFVGIVLYNIAVRLLPYAAKWALLLVKLVIRKYKELFVYLKKECIGL